MLNSILNKIRTENEGKQDANKRLKRRSILQAAATTGVIGVSSAIASAGQGSVKELKEDEIVDPIAEYYISNDKSSSTNEINGTKEQKLVEKAFEDYAEELIHILQNKGLLNHSSFIAQESNQGDEPFRAQISEVTEDKDESIYIDVQKYDSKIWSEIYYKNSLPKEVGMIEEPKQMFIKLIPKENEASALITPLTGLGKNTDSGHRIISKDLDIKNITEDTENSEMNDENDGIVPQGNCWLRCERRSTTARCAEYATCCLGDSCSRYLNNNNCPEPCERAECMGCRDPCTKDPVC